MFWLSVISIQQHGDLAIKNYPAGFLCIMIIQMLAVFIGLPSGGNRLKRVHQKHQNRATSMGMVKLGLMDIAHGYQKVMSDVHRQLAPRPLRAASAGPFAVAGHRVRLIL
jgi:hypothetical protein